MSFLHLNVDKNWFSSGKLYVYARSYTASQKASYYISLAVKLTGYLWWRAKIERELLKVQVSGQVLFAILPLVYPI